MKQRLLAAKLLIAALAAALCSAQLFGCAPVETASEEVAAAVTPAITIAPAPSAPPAQVDDAVFDPSEHLLGFIVAGGKFEAAIAGHAFLRNAEGIGYPAKLYPYSPSAVQQAIEDGCGGVLTNAALSEDEMAALDKAGCEVASIGVDIGAHARLYTDKADYSAEIARAMGDALAEGGFASGEVLVVPDSAQIDEANAFIESFKKAYPQYSARIQLSAPLESQRVEIIKSAIGVYCADGAQAGIWVQARSAAVKELTPEETPKPSATATPKPTATPAASGPPEATDAPDASSTPAPSLAPHQAVKNITIIAGDHTPENLKLLEGGGIFAIVARPYFDSAAQGAIVLDRLLREIQTPEAIRLNVPVVKKASMEKYASITQEAILWLGEDALVDQAQE